MGEGGDDMQQRPQFVLEPSALWECWGVNKLTGPARSTNFVVVGFTLIMVLIYIDLPKIR